MIWKAEWQKEEYRKSSRSSSNWFTPHLGYKGEGRARQEPGTPSSLTCGGSGPSAWILLSSQAR